MPRPLLLSLIVLVATPLVLLGWLTTSTMRARQQEANENLLAILSERLDEFDEEIQRELDQQARTLGMKLASRSNAIELLTELQRNHPLVRTGVFVSDDGLMLFPERPVDADSDSLVLYSALLAMVDSRPIVPEPEANGAKPVSKSATGKGRVLKNGQPRQDDSSPRKQLQTPPMENANSPSAITQRQATRQQPNQSVRKNPITIEDEGRWQVWYMDEGAQLVLWFERSDGTSIGLLLERARWMSDLIAILPDSDSAWQAESDEGPERAGGFTAIVDETQRTIYRWGNRFADTGDSTVSRNLSSPLASWQLQYHAAGPLLATDQSHGTIYFLAAVGILLLTLGVYVLTAVQRQMAAARSRVSFAGQVSHELRTPLTNIRLYTELAESDLQRVTDTSTRETLENRLAIIDRESQRLQRLVSGVLEMIRDGGKAMGVRLSKVNPNELIEQTVEQFRPGLDAAGIRVDTDLKTDQVIDLDPDVFEMVFVNLLSNVEKYAGRANDRDSGTCRIESQFAEGQFVLTLTDNGPGIAAAKHRQVFQPFSRLDDSIHAPSGTGIGLTIARRAAQRHGGQLRLLPNAPDSDAGGATFEFRLPLTNEEI